MANPQYIAPIRAEIDEIGVVDYDSFKTLHQTNAAFDEVRFRRLRGVVAFASSDMNFCRRAGPPIAPFRSQECLEVRSFPMF
jgi:hypothetical protein